MCGLFSNKKLSLVKAISMKAGERRKKLHSYIADMSDKQVNAMLTLLESEAVYETKTNYSNREKAEIRMRETNRIEGKSKTYSLSEAKKLFRTKKKS